jgi:hypothetical protein
MFTHFSLNVIVRIDMFFVFIFIVVYICIASFVCICFIVLSIVYVQNVLLYIITVPMHNRLGACYLLRVMILEVSNWRWVISHKNKQTQGGMTCSWVTLEWSQPDTWKLQEKYAWNWREMRLLNVFCNFLGLGMVVGRQLCAQVA